MVDKVKQSIRKKKHTENEVVLGQLSSTDLLLHGVAADVNVHVHLVVAENTLQLLDVVVHSGHDRHDENLSRAEPERPLSAKVLNKNTQESLERTDNSSVDNNGAGTAGTRLVGVRLLAFGVLSNRLAGHVFKLEVNGRLVVQLDGSTLELSLESISNGDINLGPVEGTISFVNDPVVALELGQCLLELVFGVVPGLDFTEVLLRTSGELQLESKAKQTVDGL